MDRGAIDAIKTANNAGYLVIVITNQSGIGRGLYTEEDFHYLMEAINNMLKEKGAHIDDYYYCPHHEQANLEKYKKDAQIESQAQECYCRQSMIGILI